MQFLNQVARWIVHHFNPKCASTVIAVILLVYILIYLIWSSPASFVARDKGHILHEIDLRQGVLQHHHNVEHIKESLDISPDGKGVWVEGLQVEVMSAFYDLHYNGTNAWRFLLPSFIKHSTERKFFCCFSSYSDPQNYIQVPAIIEYIDLRFMADIQNGAFECILKENKDMYPDLVSFAPQSCQADVTNPLRIIYPERRAFEFAVCTKVAYGRLDPQKLIEWFEFMHEMGTSKVITYHTALHPDSKAVFDYYVNQGFLILIPFRPREKDGVQPIQYTEETAQTRQARQEKTLTVRECQLRLAGYDYVLTIDFDEMPVPQRPHGSLPSLFETLIEEFKDASGFRMDPILLPPEWNMVKRSNWLYHWRFHSGTYIAGHCIKWIYIPSRIRLASTHKIVPIPGYKNYMLPHHYLHFLHFRTCKKERWHEIECENLTTSITNEYSLRRFAAPIIRGMRKMPLEELVPDDTFIQAMRKDRSSYRREGERR